MKINKLDTNMTQIIRRLAVCKIDRQNEDVDFGSSSVKIHIMNYDSYTLALLVQNIDDSRCYRSHRGEGVVPSKSAFATASMSSEELLNGS